MEFLYICGLLSLAYSVGAVSYGPSNYGDLMADLQYLYNIEQMKNSVPMEGPMGGYYADDGDYAKSDSDDWDYPVEADPSPKEARDYGEAALRDQEYMKQLPLSGYQFISGGTGRLEDPVDVKTDKVLPAYCTPPNPCPHGYKGPDNCVKHFENTPENNRRILGEQDCQCDTEHMTSCDGKQPIDTKPDFDEPSLDSMGDIGDMGDINLSENPYLSIGEKRQHLVAKKAPLFIQKRNAEEGYGFDPFLAGDENDVENPYFKGELRNRVAKKQAP